MHLPETPLRALYRELSSPDKRYLALACIFSVLLLLAYSFRYATVLTHGFAAYYGYAKLLLAGNFVPEIFDYGYFNAKLHELGFGSVKDAPLNLPTNAFAFLIIAFLPPAAAKLVWTILSLAFYAISIRMLLRINDISATSALGLAAIALACLWRPVYENMAYGQLYTALLLLFCLSMRGLEQNKTLFSSLPISAMLVLKGYGIPNLLWYIFNKRLVVSVFILIGVGAVVLLTWPLIGSDVWTAYYENVFKRLATQPYGGQVAYQSLTSFLVHHFVFDPQSSPAPLIAFSREAVTGIAYLVGIASLAFLLFVGKSPSAGKMHLAYSAALAVNVITSPLATEYHYILFLPLVFIFLKHLVNSENDKRLGMLSIFGIVAIILLALPLPYKHLQEVGFPFSLLAYPKFLAGSALLLNAMYSLKRTPIITQ